MLGVRRSSQIRLKLDGPNKQLESINLSVFRVFSDKTGLETMVFL